MGWMSKLLGTDDQPKSLVTEKRGGISYHPQLISEYTTTHRELEALFARIGELAGRTEMAKLPDALIAFKAGLEGHVLSENVRFYVYLEQQLKTSPNNLQLVKGFHGEMSGIARQVVQFVRKWKDAGVGAESLDAFMHEYRQIEEALQRRIKAEEKELYPLYQPPRQ